GNEDGCRGCVKKEIKSFRAVTTPAVPKRSPVAGTMDAVRPLIRQWHKPRARSLAGRILSDPIRWRPCADPVQKREPAAGRRKKGLTNQRPLQKGGLAPPGSAGGDHYKDPHPDRLRRSTLPTRGRVEETLQRRANLRPATSSRRTAAGSDSCRGF